jgi:hypothetical protein
MKTLLLVLLALFVPIKTVHAPIESNDITVLQINARWNQNKTIDLNVVYNRNKPVKQWSADLSFSLDIDVNEIQRFIDKIR